MRDRIGKFTTRVSTRASNSRASYRLRRATYGNGRLISDCLEIRRTLRNLPVFLARLSVGLRKNCRSWETRERVIREDRRSRFHRILYKAWIVTRGETLRRG